jgi:Ca2+-binding EF-hand superfamily protein
MKPIIINILLLSTLCIAETQFDLELEKDKSKLSNKVFNHYDIDKSKTLSFKEFSIFSKEMKEKEQEKRVVMTIKSCDKDGNGKIELSEVPTQKEMREMFKKRKNMATMCHMDSMRFKRIDKDNNENITKEEILLSYQRAFGEWGNPPMEMPKRDELKDFKEGLERCDKNEDGEITLIEATSDICYMTSETFLQYSSNYEKSFKIDEVTEAPKYDKDEEIDHKFKECDSNKDDQLTLVESTSKWCHISSDTFIRLNTDNNEYLAKSEFYKMYDENIEPLRIPFKIMKEMPPEAQIHIAFGQCDEDKNGKMSRDEAKACELPMEIFEKFDYDTSDTIEQNDLEMIQKRAEFEMVDMNSNNKIEPKEFEERMGNRCRIF